MTITNENKNYCERMKKREIQRTLRNLLRLHFYLIKYTHVHPLTELLFV